MYALATANSQTALFHSSVVSYQGRAYMFLLATAAGKAHTPACGLKYIEGTDLMNDDNPVVRIIDGKARVYGSPWSGKTPCYRNVSILVGAIVKLDQAPHNEIVRLKGIMAYAALVAVDLRQALGQTNRREGLAPGRRPAGTAGAGMA